MHGSRRMRTASTAGWPERSDARGASLTRSARCRLPCALRMSDASVPVHRQFTGRLRMDQAGLRARSTSDANDSVAQDGGHTLQRGLTWKDAFWVTSGVPAGGLLTIGGVCATIGKPAWAIWIGASTMGPIQSATYARHSALL